MVQRVRRTCRRMAMNLNCIEAPDVPHGGNVQGTSSGSHRTPVHHEVEARQGPHLEAPLTPRRHLRLVLLLVAAVDVVRKSPPLSQVMRTMETPPPPHMQLLVSVETPRTCQRFRWMSCLMPHPLLRHKKSRRVR
jgi:hypothetical protein